MFGKTEGDGGRLPEPMPEPLVEAVGERVARKPGHVVLVRLVDEFRRLAEDVTELPSPLRGETVHPLGGSAVPRGDPALQEAVLGHLREERVQVAELEGRAAGREEASELVAVHLAVPNDPDDRSFQFALPHRPCYIQNRTIVILSYANMVQAGHYLGGEPSS